MSKFRELTVYHASKTVAVRPAEFSTLHYLPQMSTLIATSFMTSDHYYTQP